MNKIILKEVEKGYSVCNSGKVVALVHNHPSGNINPSTKDMETAAKHRVAVCVQVNREGQTETRCYRRSKRH